MRTGAGTLSGARTGARLAPCSGRWILTPLHAVDVLASLAEGSPGPARDWAVARLAILGRGPLPHLPADVEGLYVALLCAPPKLHETLAGELRSGDASTGARAAAHLGRVGLWPADPAPLSAALAAVPGPADSWVALARARFGELDADTFAEGVRSARGDDEAPWIVPALVLARSDDDATVDAVGAELARTLAVDSRVLLGLLAWLGAPPFPDAGDLDPDDAAAFGAHVAGRAAPRGAPKGSRRRRAQGWVSRLLEGRPGPLPAILRATFSQRAEPPSSIVALAAWLAEPAEGTPIERVLRRRGGYGGDTLTEARSALTHADADALLAAIATEPATGGASVLAAALRTGPRAAALADVLIDRSLAGNRDDPMMHFAACSLASAAAPRVRALLRDRESRALGVALACWVQTEEILEALLELPLPSDPDLRWMYASALASMGDPAALPHLRELARDDEAGALVEPLALAEALLGASLAP